MVKYRKKPVEIEAIKWTGFNIREMIDFLGYEPRIDIGFETNITYLIIETLEGNMFAEAGDFIIKGVKGEFYPCKPDIFEMTYELVE